MRILLCCFLLAFGLDVTAQITNTGQLLDAIAGFDLELLGLLELPSQRWAQEHRRR